MTAMVPNQHTGFAVSEAERHPAIRSLLPAVATPARRFRRSAVPLIAWAMSLLLGACQLLPGDGPKMSRAVPDVQAPLPYDVIDLDPTSVLPYRTAVRPDGPSVARSASAGRKVSVQPGDVLKVRVLEPYEGGIFPTAQKAGADLGTQRVTDAGTISVPFVGAVEVRGLDLGQVEQRILERLKGRAQEPQVIVELVSDRSNTIMVSGDVKTPGRFSVLDGTRSVADAINRAGGPASSDNLSSPQFEVVLRRGGNVALTAQYSDLLAGRDPDIQGGDEIVVRPNPRTFTVLGAVQKSGNVAIDKTELSLLEALGAAGGLNDARANKSGIFVFRLNDPKVEPNGHSTIFRLDLMQPVSLFVAQQFNIRPRDVVYVTNAPIYEYDKALTSLYRTASVYGVLKDSLPSALSY